ncbi:bestrophin family ion channel [Tateyamaria sp. ANG-S1]|uniref:bestrophin family protein n=1 Tax=Tateyamaria sp. ANG-S1 TaxID=1577905 RepID=UPI0005807A6D|nr:bestrophin family ion channel [Tateyamaria sp. ANG-S1]KIC50351.1 hypothetical protein RA29_06455 [Tateyamaria sp. ANG-S1]
MIVKDQPSSLHLFYEMQGSIVPRIAGKILAVACLSLIVVFVDAYLLALPRISVPAMGIFGVALSLFLGFRNNAAYDRWWEARILWGTMLADVRSLGRDAMLFIRDADERRALMNHAVASVHLHRGDLRGVNAGEDAAKWVGADIAQALAQHHRPADAALRGATAHLAALADQGKLSGFGQMTLANRLASLTLSQAGCERIANTPLPFVYSLLVRRTTYLYCWLLPFALLDAADIFAPIFAAVVAYVFFGLQAVTNELEMPFRNVENGLPLDAICRAIESAAAEAMGDEAPPPVTAIDHILT